MGCNCKKKYDILKKYSDNRDESETNVGVIRRIAQFFAQFLFGILLAPLIIVVTVPFIFYVVICIMFGIEPNLVLKIPFKKRKNKQ